MPTLCSVCKARPADILQGEEWKCWSCWERGIVTNLRTIPRVRIAWNKIKLCNICKKPIEGEQVSMNGKTCIKCDTQIRAGLSWFYCVTHETVVNKVLINGMWLSLHLNDPCQCALTPAVGRIQEVR